MDNQVEEKNETKKTISMEEIARINKEYSSITTVQVMMKTLLYITVVLAVIAFFIVLFTGIDGDTSGAGGLGYLILIFFKSYLLVAILVNIGMMYSIYKFTYGLVRKSQNVTNFVAKHKIIFSLIFTLAQIVICIIPLWVVVSVLK